MSTRRLDAVGLVQVKRRKFDHIIPKCIHHAAVTDSCLPKRRNPWQDLKVPPEELTPAHSLNIGQSFTWQPLPQASQSPNMWLGVIGKHALAIRQTEASTQYKVLASLGPGGKKEKAGMAGDDVEELLRDYLQLGTPLKPLYLQWSEADTHMGHVARCIPGVRVLRQDPIECLFSFICSSNNNIARIHKMLTHLRVSYGQHILSATAEEMADLLEIDISDLSSSSHGGDARDAEEEGRGPFHFYSFPTLSSLCLIKEQELRDLGFGYRAKYIVESARQLKEFGGEAWLMDLRGKDRPHVQSQLVRLCGIGPKVADCVALFSLDQPTAIPVDVHVWRIATRDYAPELKERKSLTPTVYGQVGELFRDRFQYAGWAHSVLFAAELPQFQSKLPKWLSQQMREFKEEEREEKKSAKAAKLQAKQSKERAEERARKPS